MAKNNTTTAVAAESVNRSELIRKYNADHPGTKHSDIAKALTVGNVTVSASLVSSVLGSKGKKRNGLDVESLKATAAFIKGCGNVNKAVEAIKAVGAFIDSVGSSEDALQSIEAYQSLAAAIK
jgi:hypothetical protein